jgi:hypothetical protein
MQLRALTCPSVDPLLIVSVSAEVIVLGVLIARDAVDDRIGTPMVSVLDAVAPPSVFTEQVNALDATENDSDRLRTSCKLSTREMGLSRILVIRPVVMGLSGSISALVIGM